MRVFSLEEFAAKRRTDQDDMEKVLFPVVTEAMRTFPAQGWFDELLREVARLYTDVYHREGGAGTPTDVDRFVREVRAALEKTEDPDDTTVDRVSTWLATAILNAATMEAAGTDEEFLVLEWVTMHDADVREAHRHTDGQQRPPGEPFDVDGVEMRYPGDPTAPIELWINCRCALAPSVPNEFTRKATPMPDTDVMDQALTAAADGLGTPWYGVLAPEGVWTREAPKRSFAKGSLTHRDLPLPLTWQKAQGQGHDGSVVVAKIEQIARVGDEMRAAGHYLMTPEADEAVGLVAEFGRYGVSVDADGSSEFAFYEEEDGVEFLDARICSASMVSIPAFAEATIQLGDMPEGWLDDCDPDDPECQPEEEMVASFAEFISEKPWDGSAGRFTPEQWKRSCVLHVCDGMEKSCHKLPIREPGGALSRAGVHAAAARFNQVDASPEAKSRAKSALRGAYKQLGEEPPDVLKAGLRTSAETRPLFMARLEAADCTPEEREAIQRHLAAMDATDDALTMLIDGEVFKRGAGWLTHPEDTKRIHDYWTKPGEEGYAKIGWGAPGDFNRCRVLVGEKIAENSPEDVRFLNQICAQWHKDALGIWPGEHHSADLPTPPGDVGPALSLVAGAGWCAPSEWFKDPEFTQLTPMTVTEDGRVFGHIAGWRSCHGAYQTCVAPPHSVTGYSHFLTGYVLTEDGPVPTGPITYGTGHAPPGRMRQALAHYDNTGTVACDVTVGEDEFGIWCAGMMRPGAPEEAAHIVRASAPSGDWRRDRAHDHLSDTGKAMEMIAILSVNSPGYTVPRVGMENGDQVSLVAAGMVTAPEGELDMVQMIASMVVDELDARVERRQQMAELAARIGGQ